MEQSLTEAEEYVANLVWQRGPLPSGELVTLCAQQLDWKKSTTYTILKRLEGKGVLHVHFYSDDQLRAFANLLGNYKKEGI